MNDQTPSLPEEPDHTDHTDHTDPAEQTAPIAGITSLAPPPPVPADSVEQTAVTNAVPGDGRASGLSVGGRVWSFMARSVLGPSVWSLCWCWPVPATGPRLDEEGSQVAHRRLPGFLHVAARLW